MVIAKTVYVNFEQDALILSLIDMDFIRIGFNRTHLHYEERAGKPWIYATYEYINGFHHEGEDNAEKNGCALGFNAHAPVPGKRKTDRGTKRDGVEMD